MLRRRSRWGVTLPELVFGMGIFLLALGALFGLFTRGYQAFQFLTTRQSVQGQVLRLKGILEVDFGPTHYRSVKSDQRSITVDGVSLRRDQTCCLSLDDWNNPANFRQPSGIPMWNRYSVYQTNLEPEGKLERFSVAPGGAPLRVRPLDDLSTLSGVQSRQLLAENLKSFSCAVDPYLQDVVVTFELRETGSRRGLDQNITNETFKAEFRWTPNNTVPRF